MYKIALIDDNQEFSFVLQLFLENYFEISIFADVSSFLPSLTSKQYDLVMVDYSIPPHESESINNGCELIGYLKKFFSAPPILVLLTGWISKNDLKQGKKICPYADQFIAKDSDLNEILAQLNQFLARRV